jgi:hypothetical protein
MVARKNRRKDLQSILGLHLEACQRREELIAEARELRAAGKNREARVVMKTIQFVREHVAALENDYGAEPCNYSAERPKHRSHAPKPRDHDVKPRH